MPIRALSIADRGYVLETGKVVLSGAGEELLASNEVRKAYLGGMKKKRPRAFFYRLMLIVNTNFSVKYCNRFRSVV